MKLIKKIWWIPLVVYMIVIPSFMSARVYNEICGSVSINIIDSADCRFVTPATIMDILHHEDLDPVGTNLNYINLKRIEERLSEEPELEGVEVYYTADGKLHIQADQRDPLLRVITRYGNSYYIDKKGCVIPHNQFFTPRMVVVSGNIEVPDSCIMGVNIQDLDDDALILKTYDLVKYLQAEKFWSSFIEQIYINNKGEMEIVPRIGDHIIRFGAPIDYEWKFKVLKTFYSEVIGRAGWDKYSEIDLRFSGQIVCRK